ncbi:uncharacterized protein EV154DRAFT_554709 [Mucor mucedo]|uniref:uncharacterized protein n=1 Tax=Mucor mucedo TaxID=29922 RepID=UPI00221FAD33|nr:uncharacterized protein EV154DRAFT_554709 [Mucor mucedo]KAI7886228.1 hypothetical protein EV154DRAFT_554709 [Mucor mucedo]
MDISGETAIEAKKINDEEKRFNLYQYKHNANIKLHMEAANIMAECNSDLLHNYNNYTLSCNTFFTQPRYKLKSCLMPQVTKQSHCIIPLNKAIKQFQNNSTTCLSGFEAKNKFYRVINCISVSFQRISPYDTAHNKSADTDERKYYDFCQIPPAGGLSYDVGRLGEAWNYGSNSHCRVDSGIRKEKLRHLFPIPKHGILL